MSEDKKDQRKSYFKVLDRSLQKDLYFYLAIVWITWVILIGSYIALIQALDEFRVVDGPERTFILVSSFLVISAIKLLIELMIFNRFLSRITGPIYRIEASLESWVTEGVRQPIQLRQGDYFMKLATLINENLAQSSETGGDSQLTLRPSTTD